MIKILICDDSDFWLDENERLVQDILKDTYKYKIEKYNDPKYISGKYDIAILDIELKEQTGLDLAEKMISENKNVSIIFITNYDTFTKEAYSICADGYLTKPVDKNTLGKLLRKSITYVLGLETGQAVLQFYCERNYVILKQKNIMYIERVGRKVIIAATQREYSIINSLSEIEAKLEDFFIKINQGIIVNMYEIINMEKMYIFLANGKIVKISRGYWKQVVNSYIKFQNR